MQNILLVNFIYFSTFFICLIPEFTWGQSSFNSGLFSGLSLTQIDGDGYSGFDKPGLILGGSLSNDFGWENKSLQMELQFVQKGSRRPANPEKGIPPYLIKLSYFEIPVLFRYYYKKIYFAGGLSYGRLIAGSHKEYDISGEVPNRSPFKKSEIAITGGGSYFLTKKISVEIKAARSVIPVRDYAILSQFGFFGITSSGIFGGSYNSALYYTVRYQFGENTENKPKEEEKNMVKEILKIED